MKPLYLVLGAFGLLLMKKSNSSKKRATPQESAIQLSKSALQLSAQPGGQGVSAPQQTALLTHLLQREVAPLTHVSGMAPFDLSDNKPTPKEVVILYSLDPDFVIEDLTTGGKVSVSDLLPEAVWADPSMQDYLQRSTPADRIQAGISLLPPDRVLDFSLALAYDAAPIYKAVKAEAAYARCLDLLTQGVGWYEELYQGRMTIREVEGLWDAMRTERRQALSALNDASQGMEFFMSKLFDTVANSGPYIRPSRTLAELQHAISDLLHTLFSEAHTRAYNKLTYEQKQEIYAYQEKVRQKGEKVTPEERKRLDKDLYEKGLYDKPTGGSDVFLFGAKPDVMQSVEEEVERAMKKHADDYYKLLKPRLLNRR